MSDKERLEQKMVELLAGGDAASGDPDSGAVDRLGTRYEARAQAQIDPIVEETIKIRSVVREVDGRYDSYMSRASKDTN